MGEVQERRGVSGACDGRSDMISEEAGKKRPRWDRAESEDEILAIRRMGES